MTPAIGPPNMILSTAYNSFGEATEINYGSLDFDQFSYDGNTGRETQYLFSINESF